MSKSLLGVFAHPDDETFLAGPILAKYAAENVHVELTVSYTHLTLTTICSE